ncbi:MAG: flagellar basal body L-ring protein FlgH [Nitrospirota bacterium]
MRFLFFIIFILAVCPVGCSFFEPQVKVPAEPAAAAVPASKPFSQGSLWADGQRSLFGDNRAKDIGDIITVNLVESVQASYKADTTTSTNSSFSALVSNIFGLPASLGLSNLWGKGNAANMGVNSAMTSQYAGTGASDRQRSIIGTVSVLVVDKTPNGNLVIAGKQEVSLSREKEFIVVSGYVRPADIAPDNSILSTQVADARVVYKGSGVLSDKQGPGWLSRIIDNVWPF